jgi:hypothetical protein
MPSDCDQLIDGGVTVMELRPRVHFVDGAHTIRVCQF